MDRLEAYRTDLARLGRDRFLAQVAAVSPWWLVKRPITAAKVAEMAANATPSGQILYETQAVRARPKSGSGSDVLDEDPIFATQWRVLPIKKKEGNPFPERIGVGRAVNCDLTVRFSFVSKLHAHFVPMGTRALTICDQRSANGTFLNGAQLDPGKATTVRAGDVIRLGALDLHLVDAAGFADTVATSRG